MVPPQKSRRSVMLVLVVLVMSTGGVHAAESHPAKIRLNGA